MQTPAAPLVAQYVELGGSEFLYLARSLGGVGRHWTAHHLLTPNMQLTVDPLDLPTLEGTSPQWMRTWDAAVITLRMAPAVHGSVLPGVEDLLTVARAAQVQQPASNIKD